MIRTYSRRILSPFIGVVQIAETPEACALSLDGRNWEIQYAKVGEALFRSQHPGVDPRPRFSLVAIIEKGALKTDVGYPVAASNTIRAAIDQLYAAVSDTSLPFDAAHEHEYWLLDEGDGAPLALLQSRVETEDREFVSQLPYWVAMPAAQLAVPGTEAPGGTYVPPVNYRLEQAVKHRAGSRPRAIWLSTANSSAARRDFPPGLLREDWPDEEQRLLCERYINRLAPRLLMLSHLPAKRGVGSRSPRVTTSLMSSVSTPSIPRWSMTACSSRVGSKLGCEDAIPHRHLIDGRNGHGSPIRLP